MSAHDDPQAALAFGRGFLALQYLLGCREQQLLPPLDLPEPARASCETLVQQLSMPDKATRARVLAPEIATLVRALQEREIA